MVFVMGEPKKMAAFLRERCDRGMYDLRYLNPEKTLIWIPWPTASRNGDDLKPLQPGFQLYEEWATLSFMKRGIAMVNNEQPPAQKHRFRNALSRADGLKAIKDVDGGRIFEFLVQGKRSRGHSSTSNVGSSDGRGPNSPFYAGNPVQNSQLLQPQPLAHSAHHDQDNGCDFDLEKLLDQSFPPYQQELHQGGYSNTLPLYNQQTEMANYQGPGEMLDCIPNGKMNHSPIPDIELDELIADFDANSQPMYENAPQLNHTERVTPQIHPLGVPLPRPAIVEDHSCLQIKVIFRGEEQFSYDVTNQSGCRVYSGSCAPKLAQYLHPGELMQQKHPMENLIGPETLEQVKLPSVANVMSSERQKLSTDSILNNMGRGLILTLNYKNANTCGGIPDVFAVRLCQTRIFPFTDDQARDGQGQDDRISSNIDAIKRMEWTKVFDGNVFYQRLQTAQNSSGFPSPYFNLSLGQRTAGKQKSALFVAMTVRVQKAHSAIQARLDRWDSDVFISVTTSMDEAASRLAHQIKQNLTLD